MGMGVQENPTGRGGNYIGTIAKKDTLSTKELCPLFVSRHDKPGTPPSLSVTLEHCTRKEGSTNGENRKGQEKVSNFTHTKKKQKNNSNKALHYNDKNLNANLFDKCS
ncbi:hypothetical protein BaRGS_00015692 [Batillaria attramentaria]|uniref:Uncharacterized protein n=1 Tax=Batillaria attramentaria TaxID=370345 RepID=A0ABD0L0N8_9CAEN